MNIDYTELISRCWTDGFEELDITKDRAEFYDDYDGRHIFVNNVENKEMLSFIYENDIFEYINKEVLNSILNKINKDLFLNLNQIVFVVNENDRNYLEEEYAIDSYRRCYLGRYNYEYSVVVVNFRTLLVEVARQLKDECNYTKENFDSFLSEQILITLIHEIGHCIYSCEYLNGDEMPFEDFGLKGEEDVVESYAEKVVSSLHQKTYLLNPDFVALYFEKEEEVFNDEFFD